ncbi:hypothetical protein MLD38_010410 [Melastoma candidum]|uniref:Uncharacterized protein n=1 Tax=Melastoma candidum TaxID=119954 RepID=A0ACB9R3V2_9MYRT|nr:hypothetical protein MLD38_010410 [Melastoma candidum]
MLPSSSRLSPLAKPFSLKKGHDHQQHVRMDMRCFPEGDWMSCSGFSGLPAVPSLDLDNYLTEEADVKGGGICSLSCEKGIGSSSLISSQPYSSMVARILDEYGPEKAAKESDLFDCDQKMISSGSNRGFHSPDVDSGWDLQKDESSIGRQDGFLFKGKDAINSLAFHADMNKEKAAEGIETVGDVAPHLGRIKLDHKEIEKDDSDVDSPCWKGLSFNQSHSRAYGALDSQHPDAKLVAKNILNPLAPQFFPQNAKSWSNYEESKFVAEDLFSFARTTSAPPTGVLPETLDLDEDFCSPVIYGPLWHTAHNDMSDHGNKLLQKGDEKLDFCLDQPLTEENYFRFTGETEMLTGFTGQESDMVGPAAKKAISVPLLSGPNAAGTLSEQKNSVPVLTKPAGISNTNFSASAAINTSLNVNEEVLVDTMHDLSKLLLTKCHGERSFGKLNHERIQTVISNLLICVGGVHARRDSIHEPAISDKSYKYADAFTKTDSVILRKGSHEASGSSSGAPIRIHQSSEKTQSAVCFNEAKISQHTELYRTLWLEAQAELSSLKSKAANSHTKF